jgi:hypothetical protein
VVKWYKYRLKVRSNNLKISTAKSRPCVRPSGGFELLRPLIGAALA